MKNDIKELICSERLYFDGGFGTMLQQLKDADPSKENTPPEEWNLLCPEAVVSIHRAYLEAGCNFITTNTFGVHSFKQQNYRELIRVGIRCAKKAREEAEAAIEGASSLRPSGPYLSDRMLVFFDLGPTGRLLKPLGDLEFETAVESFAENVRVAVEEGVDGILIETMNDSLETKAAVLAAKENSDLPIFVTNVYDKGGKLMTGADPEAMIALLEGLGVDMLGMNCSYGPDVMIRLLDRFTQNASVPLMVSPNAGLPSVRDGKTVFDIAPSEFARDMRIMAEKGVSVLGGCCGTTPEYIRQMVMQTADIPPAAVTKKDKTMVSSYTHAEWIGSKPLLIGERINPTGKPKLKKALREGALDYVLSEGIRQQESGVQMLDVNVGLPDIDEPAVMKAVVEALQSVCDLPLQLDSSDPKTLERSMRVYNGKPLINSVSGKEESMSQVFPLVQKYGGTIIALTMDEQGIPATAGRRVEIAETIAKRAKKYGIEKKDLIIDPLCMAVSSEGNAAVVTLEAVQSLKEKGFKTSLGVSNISFGLPERNKINTAFFAAALERGLDLAIMNPFAQGMMDVYYASLVLKGLDPACEEFIRYAGASKTTSDTVLPIDDSLYEVIRSGRKEAAERMTEKELENKAPLTIIDTMIIPALTKVGADFETKKIFLPQLLMSAEAASGAFEVVRRRIPKDEIDDSRAMVLATVKGDIHDIGKNIVKTLLESYGFKVYDLGRDVDPSEVLAKVQKTGCRLVGLSALMTTTVPSMEETIQLLKKEVPEVRVVVGGAVLNQHYADRIGADAYCKDAMETVRFAERFYR